MPARSPDSSPVKHVWDQLKRQMPSCHSVHDLELAAQDLWAHLPQDNIRCLINAMPDHVAACIAAGGGSTFYIGPQLVICVSDYELIKEILNHPLTLARPPQAFDFLVGKGGNVQK
ncbi:transposable element Tcb2 transposase [Trichonephila clavipes]|nr:transposable element Tcb2 transposase [Trichonephila clavipes]